MANIAVIFRQDVRGDRPVLCYARCAVDALRAKGHTVLTLGEGHSCPSWEGLVGDYAKGVDSFDLILEIENGRGADGRLRWQAEKIKSPTPKAVWFIDSHGHALNHQAAAPYYDHVFFAVWNKRDLFAGHPSAHWLPCTTDLRYFGYENLPQVEIAYDVAFYSSKLGLGRADDLVDRCRKNGWTCDVREAVKPRRNRWPATGEAMRAARVLFNKGQKRDGPNQRVVESMAVRRPLLSDNDPDSGMPLLFVDGRHYLAYSKMDPADLEEKLRYLLENPERAVEMATAAYEELVSKHLIEHRVDRILEVCGVC